MDQMLPLMTAKRRCTSEAPKWRQQAIPLRRCKNMVAAAAATHTVPSRPSM